MTENISMSKDKYVCKNCDTAFHGNFCPECGQSVREFERPFKFLIIDLTGNIFAFDTRFWKTFTTVLFKPGRLTLDYVKGHRIKYMPPFRFYVFISFIFFILLNIYSARMSHTDDESKSRWLTIEPLANVDSVSVTDSTGLINKEQYKPVEQDKEAEKMAFFKQHPELFFEKLWTYFSWVMFLLMPFYGFLLWLFYRKTQRYYITHLIMAINQHAFTFVVLLIILLFHLILLDFSAPFINYLLLLIPVYLIIGHKILYRRKTGWIILKMVVISFIYTSVILTITLVLVIFILAQTGIDFGTQNISIF